MCIYSSSSVPLVLPSYHFFLERFYPHNCHANKIILQIFIMKVMAKMDPLMSVHYSMTMHTSCVCISQCVFDYEYV